MKIGLTYDLRSDYLAAGYSEEETAEFDREDTIEAIENALSDLGHQPERIGHARRLVEALCQGHRWDLVFNIAEGMRGMGREAQVPAILDVYGIPYTFSDPLVMSLTLHKGMTKQILRDAGLPTADRKVPKATIRVAKKCNPLPTRFMPNSMTPRNPASRKKALSTSYPISGPSTGPVLSEKTLQLVPNW